MNNRIKVMHVVLSMKSGGLEHIVNQLTKKADQEIFKNYVCCLDQGGYFLDDIPESSVVKYVFSRKPVLIDFVLLWKLIKVIRKKKIDIIHSHSGCTFYAACAGRIGGVKGIVHTDHGRLVPDRKGLIIEDFIFSRLVDRFIGVSEQLTNYLSEVVRVPSKKLMTIINGIDTQKFKPTSIDDRNHARAKLNLQPDTKVIGCVCRLDQVKNIPSLLHSTSNMLKEKNYTFILVGDGPARQEIENTIYTLDIHKSVLLLGERKDISKIIPLFDVFVLSSLSEGTSMTLLEAMACGVPVIASKVGGNPQIIQDGLNGYLFELNKPKMMIKQIEDILNDRYLALKFGKEGRRLVKKKYSFEKMYNNYCQIYTELYYKKGGKSNFKNHD